MKLHRVVVTGMAAVTPLGNDLATSWTNLLGGVSGAGPITRFDPTGFDTTFACEVKGFDPSPFIPAKQAKRLDLFAQYAVAASLMAIKDADLAITPELAPHVGTIIGCGMGGLSTIEEQHKKLLAGGPSRVSPFFIPVLIANMAAGQAAIFTGAKGPNVCTTTACASGAHGVGYAYTDIMLGRSKAMICGGVESTIAVLAVSGFNALKALSTRNDDPKRASRPFDKERTGFVIGEGAGILVLEELEFAKARGARILAEVVGFGASGDAFHMTAPPESGEGMALAMGAALRESGLKPEEIDCVNAHGTSTQLNDACETKAVKTVFGSHAHKLSVTANKSMIGHCLGAAGAIESVFSIKSIMEQVVPPTINYTTPDPDCDLDYTPGEPRKREVRAVMNNSFGFGGTNASVVFKRFE
ncbi:3-oxoacyl-[acyl-carrier-protein] synthase 2 [Fundidesulfovibrio magnetotacticus]|uniref:3-oxoacyl-[acyl-carrier-protein] synthase 2 n=1 Tax=Fundidesulfovibrio magnetotacticus TaxID=2730080 RepID=A0A6V8LYF5_9BACT|nr:beta-ketoacyl-ACP synthase II [Fundidesulfovibrio magnetotacticus]GFK95621.1 3-oxoacyl-[acyl-carrier-protein] synthase 2 [Fundidesulfovibrio magnetotacticus]